MRRSEYSILLDSRFQDEEEKASFEYIEVIKTKRKPQHSHPELEFLLVLAGSGLRIIGDSVEEFEDGDLCLVGPDLYHTWFSRVVEKPAIRALVIHFTQELFGEHLLSLPEFQSVNRILEESKHGLCISGKTRDNIARMMQEIGRLHPVSPKRFSLLLSILAEVSGSDDYHLLTDEEGNPVYHGKRNEMLATIHGLLQNNLHNPLNQSWVAEKVGMSSAAFSRYFRRHTGKTYTDFVNELRIKCVCRALVESDRDVSTIALDMGFNNISYFNQVFKRMKGMPPSEYRRMLAEPISA